MTPLNNCSHRRIPFHYPHSSGTISQFPSLRRVHCLACSYFEGLKLRKTKLGSLRACYHNLWLADWPTRWSWRGERPEVDTLRNSNSKKPQQAMALHCTRSELHLLRIPKRPSYVEILVYVYTHKEGIYHTCLQVSK